MPQWIKVKDNLPEECTVVLVTNGEETSTAYHLSGLWFALHMPERWDSGGEYSVPWVYNPITHWMPVPQLDGKQ